MACRLGARLHPKTPKSQVQAAACAELRRMRTLPVDRLVDQTWSEAASECYEPAADRRDGARVVKPLTSLEALGARAFHGVPSLASSDLLSRLLTASGAFNGVPVLLGVTEHDGLGKCELEWTMFAENDVKTPGAYRTLLASQFGDARQSDALGQYPATTAEEVEDALGAISNDLWYHMGTWLMADLLTEAAHAAPVYCFCITQVIAISHRPRLSTPVHALLDAFHTLSGALHALC